MSQPAPPPPPPPGPPPPQPGWWPPPRPRRSYAAAWWVAMVGFIALALGQVGEANGSLIQSSKSGHVYGALGFIVLAVACLIGGIQSRA